MSKIKNYENVPEPAVKYRFSKKLNRWVRTWFTVEKDGTGSYFRQNVAFSKDRNTIWEKWSRTPS